MSRKGRTAHRALISVLLLGASGCAIFEHNPALKIDPVQTPLAALTAPDDVFYKAAVHAISVRDYALALDYLQAARQKAPDDVRVWNGFGVVYDKLGRFDLSARYYAEAEKLDPNSSVVAANLAYSARLQGKPAAVATLAESEAAANSNLAATPNETISTAAIAPAETGSSSTAGSEISLRNPPQAPKAEIILGFPPAAEAPPEPVAVLASPSAAAPVVTTAPLRNFASLGAEPSPVAATVVPAPPPAGPLVTVPVISPRSVAALALAVVRDKVATIVPPHALTPAALAAPEPHAGVPETRLAVVQAKRLSQTAALPAVLHRAQTKVALATPPTVSAPHRQTIPLAAKIKRTAAEMPAPAGVTKPAQPSNHAAVVIADLAATTRIPYAPGKAPVVPIRAKPQMHQALLIGRPLVIINASGNADASERMRERLVSRGWTAPRSEMSNAARQTQTTILFEPADAAVARALARTLAFPAQLESCRKHCDGLRLVLGRDLLKAHFVEAASAALKRG